VAVVTALTNNVFDNIIVENVPIQDSRPIILISNHSSLFDFQVQGRLYLENGLNPAIYPAGSNLFAHVMNPILRGCAAACIDRDKVVKDELYAKTVFNLLTTAVSQGHNIIWYPEGGRSYDGGFREFTDGVFMAARTAQRINPNVECVYVNATISYDYPPEADQIVASRNRGQSWSTDKLGDVIGFINRFWRNYGNVYVNFGTPFTLNDISNGRVREKIKQRTLEEWKQLYRVTLTEVACYSAGLGGIGVDDFKDNYQATIDELRTAGANVARDIQYTVPELVLEDRLVQRILSISDLPDLGHEVICKNEPLKNYFANRVRAVL